MARAQPRFFYRCYSNESAGGLRSGRYRDGHRALSEEDLLNEFEIHRERENRQSTALVSVTSRPLEALNRALKKYYRYHEDPGKIWIVIIRVPDGRNRPRHALRLAQRRKYPDAEVFKYKNEYVFEWEIPEEYVVHRISVRALIIHRGVERKLALLGLQYPEGFSSFREMRINLLEDMKSDPSDTGRRLGNLAKAFGARAYTYEIASRTLKNCLSGGYIDEDNQYVYFYWADTCGSLEFR